MSRSIADLTEALARNAEAVCRNYLPDGQRQGPLLDDRRCARHTRPIHVRPLERAEQRQGCGGQVDRCRHRRTWRPARHHPRDLRADRLQGRSRGSAALPQSAATRTEQRRETPFRISSYRIARKPADGCSQSHAPFSVRLQRRICANAASPICAKPDHSVFTPTAITGPTDIRRPRPGQR